MNIKKRDIKEIINLLKREYPKVKTTLKHKNVFELLIATILSAQSTDNQVNKVTKELFKIYQTPKLLAEGDIEDIKKTIYSTGFYKNKAQNIKKCAILICEKHSGEVPNDIDSLIKLAGVGRKTANVVLSSFYGVPSMVVDTHVARITKRLNLTKNSSPVKIEEDLKKIVPKKEWNNFSLRVIFFGRRVCIARKPKCTICNLSKFCVFKSNQEFKK